MEDEITEIVVEDIDITEQTNQEIKLDILEIQLDSKRNNVEATEIMVQVVESKHKFYTIRDDDKEEIWCYQDGIYIPNGATIIKEKCREILGEHCTSQFVNQVIFKIETDTYIDQNIFFNNNIIEEIITENGVLNLKTHELTPYTPDKIFFTKIPIKYNTSSICPSIEQFFKDVIKNEEDIYVIQELFGYLLWKEYNIERSIMLIGGGRNGKSKVLDLMKRFVGPENCSNVNLQDLEGDNFNKSELHKKLANLCGDIDDRSLKFTGSFKEITGRDIIKGNRKFKTPVYFENYAKMVFSANQLPKTHDISEAFFMRWVILEFPYTFIKEEEYEKVKDNPLMKLRDPNIIQKIAVEEEMSGLLNWSLQGLKRLQSQKDFSYNKSGNDVKEMWLRKSNSFMAFCMDSIEEAYGFDVEKSDVRHAYNEYCKKHKLKPVGDKSINYTLTTEYGAYDRQNFSDGNRAYFWCGIRLKSGDEVDESDQQKLEILNNVLFD